MNIHVKKDMAMVRRKAYDAEKKDKRRTCKR